jgi:hypothetical protein
MNINFADNHTEIRSILGSLGNGSKHSWVTIAILLLQVEQTKYWVQDFTSYASCLRDIANKLSLKESLLWRYRRAAIFYNQFYKSHINSRITDLLDLEHLTDISPDNIDLLEKLSRVMPEDELELLVEKVTSRQVGRRTLYEKWLTLRLGLNGRTARGKGAPTPRLDKKDLILSEKYIEDKILSLLQDVGPSWTGVNSASRYLVLRSSSYQFLSKHYTVAAVVVVQKANSNFLEFHGIEIKNSIDRTLVQNLPKEQYFDFTWLVCNTIGFDLDITEIPQHLGIITVEYGKVTIIRPGLTSENAASQKLSLLNDILLQLLPK